MKRKTLSVLAACLALCLLLAACGADLSAYPVMDAVALADLALEVVSNDEISVQYPAGEWTGVDGSVPLTVYYAETMDSGQAVNVNAQQSGTYSGKLTEKYLNSLLESFAETFPNMDIQLAELRTLDGKPVIYMESVMQFTNDAIDYFIEQGVWTEDYIDSVGGRDFILSIPPTDQVTLYTVKGAYLYVYTGTYYEASQKDAVLRCMTILAETTEEVK